MSNKPLSVLEDELEEMLQVKKDKKIVRTLSDLIEGESPAVIKVLIDFLIERYAIEIKYEK